MTESKGPMRTSWIDPDDAPDLSTPTWRKKFARASLREDDKIVRRGRPPLAHPKQAVSLRLDRIVIESFKAGGRGWQTHINKVLRDNLPRAAKIEVGLAKTKGLQRASRAKVKKKA
jgi:uncharacterized protein (DUF4415 family)